MAISMRISTQQIYSAGANGIGRNQNALLKLQMQMSTGRRVLTPADDPIASAQSLVLSQSEKYNTQMLRNIDVADGALSNVDSQLAYLGNRLTGLRDRLVQAADTLLNAADRTAIATELEATFGEILGMANTKDSSGVYLFSGYQGAVQPYSPTATGATYFGDDGKRLLQVSASRQIPSNVTGSDVFDRIRQGNGTFATAALGNIGGGLNQGSGIINQGSVINPAAWTTAINTDPANANLDIRFTQTVNAGVTTTTYQIFRGATELTNGAQPFVAGQEIRFNNFVDNTVAPPAPPLVPSDFGISVSMDGLPANGDTFSVRQSQEESVFTTMRSAIALMTDTALDGSPIEYSNRLAGLLQNIDQGLENINKVRAGVGANLVELDSIKNNTEDKSVQYAASISKLVDLDYTKAISDLMIKQTQLQAAQQSFQRISGLSLFTL